MAFDGAGEPQDEGPQRLKEDGDDTKVAVHYKGNIIGHTPGTKGRAATMSGLRNRNYAVRRPWDHYYARHNATAAFDGPDELENELLQRLEEEEDDDADMPVGVDMTHEPIRPLSTFTLQQPDSLLRIGLGGFVADGVLEKLLEHYIRERVEPEKQNVFRVEFYATDAETNVSYLESNVIDIAIIDNLKGSLHSLGSVAQRMVLGWSDDLVLAGPISDPAKLDGPTVSSLQVHFSILHSAASRQNAKEAPVFFLSPHDASSTHVHEASIWLSLGLTPWTSGKPWYIPSTGLTPAEALHRATRVGSYILTDTATWAANPAASRTMKIFSTAQSQSHDELRRSAYFVTGAASTNAKRALDFVTWLESESGGQRVVQEYQTGPASQLPQVNMDGAGPSDVATPDSNDNQSQPSQTTKTAENGPQDSKTADVHPVPEEPKTTEEKPERAAEPEKPAPVAAPPADINLIHQGPLTSEGHGPPTLWRAAVVLPWSPTEAYFFEGTRYCRVNAVLDTITHGKPFDIKDNWPDLAQCTRGINSILQTGPDSKEAWFFSGNQCLLLNIEDGKVVPGSVPEAWENTFLGLKGSLPSFDCIVPHFWPGGNPNHATFFCGGSAVTYDKVKQEVVKDDGLEWLVDIIKTLGFAKIDTFVFVPTTQNQDGYFFSRGQYVRINFVKKQKSFNVSDVQRWWRSLRVAGFFDKNEAVDTTVIAEAYGSSFKPW